MSLPHNIVLISDASLKTNHHTILAVKDMHTGITYQKVINKPIKNSTTAEEMALQYAISIAKTKSYAHVIFVFDCLAINKDKFLKRYSRNFQTMQMLWLKRKYISNIDFFTKKESSPESIKLKSLKDEEIDFLVAEELKHYAKNLMENEIISILSKGLLNNKVKYIDTNRSSFLNLIYHLISKNGKKKIKRYVKSNTKDMILIRYISEKLLKSTMEF